MYFPKNTSNKIFYVETLYRLFQITRLRLLNWKLWVTNLKKWENFPIFNVNKILLPPTFFQYGRQLHFYNDFIYLVWWVSQVGMVLRTLMNTFIHKPYTVCTLHWVKTWNHDVLYPPRSLKVWAVRSKKVSLQLNALSERSSVARRVRGSEWARVPC